MSEKESRLGDEPKAADRGTNRLLPGDRSTTGKQTTPDNEAETAAKDGKKKQARSSQLAPLVLNRFYEPDDQACIEALRILLAFRTVALRQVAAVELPTTPGGRS